MAIISCCLLWQIVSVREIAMRILAISNLCEAREEGGEEKREREKKQGGKKWWKREKSDEKGRRGRGNEEE